MGNVERWHLTKLGREHVVEIRQTTAHYQLRWLIDGEEVAAKKTSDEKVALFAEGHGAVGLVLPSFMGPAKRVGWMEASSQLKADVKMQARPNLRDFTPEEGSRAAERLQWIEDHPRLHLARQTAKAASTVLIPLLGVWLLSLIGKPDINVNLPDIPWPRLPSIPWPDLPSIPWPDLPSIPVPDLPAIPAWAEPIVKLIFAVLVAVVVARAEIKRRRTHQERQAEFEREEREFLARQQGHAQDFDAGADNNADADNTDSDSGQS